MKKRKGEQIQFVRTVRERHSDTIFKERVGAELPPVDRLGEKQTENSLSLFDFRYVFLILSAEFLFLDIYYKKWLLSLLGCPVEKPPW